MRKPQQLPATSGDGRQAEETPFWSLPFKDKVKGVKVTVQALGQLCKRAFWDDKGTRHGIMEFGVGLASLPAVFAPVTNKLLAQAGADPVAAALSYGAETFLMGAVGLGLMTRERTADETVGKAVRSFRKAVNDKVVSVAILGVVGSALGMDHANNVGQSLATAAAPVFKAGAGTLRDLCAVSDTPNPEKPFRRTRFITRDGTVYKFDCPGQ